MLICRNAEGVRGKRKVGNPGLESIFRQSVKFCIVRVWYSQTALCHSGVTGMYNYLQVKNLPIPLKKFAGW